MLCMKHSMCVLVISTAMTCSLVVQRRTKPFPHALHEAQYVCASNKYSYDLFLGCAEEEERAYYLETQAARKQQKKLKGRGKMKKRGQDKVCVGGWGVWGGGGGV